MIRCFDQPLANGITLACRGVGAGRVRALLLHGFPEAAFVWNEVLEQLAPRAAAVAPNLRGYVGSSAPAELSACRARLWPFFGSASWLTEPLRQQYRVAWANGGRGLAGPLNHYRVSPLCPPSGADDALPGWSRPTRR